MLTEHQRKVLMAVEDWKSSLEVILMIYPKPHTRRNRPRRSMAVWRTLQDFKLKDMVRYGASQNTWKRTTKGTNALAAQ